MTSLQAFCFKIDQKQSPHTYYLSRLNIAGAELWYITLEPMETMYWAAPDNALSRGYETADAALQAWQKYADLKWPVKPPMPWAKVVDLVDQAEIVIVEGQLAETIRVTSQEMTIEARFGRHQQPLLLFERSDNETVTVDGAVMTLVESKGLRVELTLAKHVDLDLLV